MDPETALRPLIDTLVRAGVGPYGATATITLVAALSGLGVAALAQWLLRRHLRELASRTRTQLDDLVVGALDGPIIALGALAGAAWGLMVSPTSDATRRFATASLSVLVGAALIVACARFVHGAIGAYGERARLAVPTRALLRRLGVVAVVALGALVLLDGLGVRVTPLLTTLGLAGLALALALQDTLTNFFSGIYVQADEPLAEGHYVRVEDANVEGYVQEVGWRTTKIRTLGNNLVVIPNAKVAASVVTDYDLPEPRMSLLVRVPIDARTDPARAEAIILQVAKAAAGTIPGFLATPEPFVRFIPGFTEYGAEFTLICQVETFVDQYLAQHELRHRIAHRLAQEGIRLGAPQRVIVPAAPHDASIPLDTPAVTLDTQG